MKYILPAFTTIISIALLAITPPVFASPLEKAEICHFDLDYGVWTLIIVSGNAVNKHFTNHDDGLPGSETLGTATLLDGECAPNAKLTCPCWDTYFESDLVAALTFGPDPDVSFCLLTSNLVDVVSIDIDGIRQVHAIVDPEAGSLCSLQFYNVVSVGLGLLDVAVGEACFAEAAALIPLVYWCSD